MLVTAALVLAGCGEGEPMTDRDVDIIHFCPEHPDWVGANHSYGEDHTSCGPMGNIGSNCDGMLDHYLLTGDPDSFAAANELAERLLTCRVWARCARETGWPLSQLVRWYDQTGDPRFLRKARQFMQAIYAYVEPRRGVLPRCRAFGGHARSCPSTRSLLYLCRSPFRAP